MHCMVMKRLITSKKVEDRQILSQKKIMQSKYAQNRKMVRKKCISWRKVNIMTIYTCCNTDNN